MRKSEIYTLLGLTLDICIRRFHFPALEQAIFTSKDYSNLRSQLYKAPTNDHKLGQYIIKLLLKGKIEEIKTLEEALILNIQFEHKQELYIAELKLENDTWVFLSIHYAGEAPPAKQMGMWAGIIVVALSILLFSAMFVIHYFQDQQETSTQLTEATQAEPSAPEIESPSAEDESLVLAEQEEETLPLTELEEMARKMDLVLINEEEYQHLLQEKEQQAEDHGEADIPSVMITVQYGMAAEQVAKLLVDSELEVAQDVEELTNFFIEQNIQYRIRTGTHHIPLNASYIDIVHILTNRK